MSGLAVAWDTWGSVGITLALIWFWLAEQVRKERTIRRACPNIHHRPAQLSPSSPPPLKTSFLCHTAQEDTPRSSKHSQRSGMVPSKPNPSLTSLCKLLSQCGSSAYTFEHVHGKHAKHGIYATRDVWAATDKYDFFNSHAKIIFSYLRESNVTFYKCRLYRKLHVNGLVGCDRKCALQPIMHFVALSHETFTH